MRLPSIGRELVDPVLLVIVLVLLALYAPLYGALLSLFVVWHSDRNGLVTRRNIAIACAALGVFDLLSPGALVTPIMI